MQKIICSLVAFCFSFNVFASTGTFQELERTFDEYQYALTVEWDQKDQTFHEAQTQIFFSRMSELMTQGLTKDDVQAFAEKKIQDPRALEALKLKLNLLTQVSGHQELARTLSQNADEFYARGASWSGRVDPIMLLGGLALAAVLGYAIWFSFTHECVAWGERWECNSDTTYTDYGSYTDTVCGWRSYCTSWVKK